MAAATATATTTTTTHVGVGISSSSLPPFSSSPSQEQLSVPEHHTNGSEGSKNRRRGWSKSGSGQRSLVNEQRRESLMYPSPSSDPDGSDNSRNSRNSPRRNSQGEAVNSERSGASLSSARSRSKSKGRRSSANAAETTTPQMLTKDCAINKTYSKVDLLEEMLDKYKQWKNMDPVEIVKVEAPEPLESPFKRRIGMKTPVTPGRGNYKDLPATSTLPPSTPRQQKKIGKSNKRDDCASHVDGLFKEASTEYMLYPSKSGSGGDNSRSIASPKAKTKQKRSSGRSTARTSTSSTDATNLRDSPIKSPTKKKPAGGLGLFVPPLTQLKS